MAFQNTVAVGRHPHSIHCCGIPVSCFLKILLLLFPFYVIYLMNPHHLVMFAPLLCANVAILEKLLHPIMGY